ncbi:MAG TPA: DUF2797 domain-containing protein [Candidatus Avipropionibacterium avicola]|uniref:DUF2797 domain-containing protein n=1 Tax=Candidatus Avipropionibacterium avicola TaxID=2840701 RepID=A0A9D1GVS7_9ACTN|nr:DUF2797 domain-containing protein [Candidatus Avipropionibacterium avicola]
MEPTRPDDGELIVAAGSTGRDGSVRTSTTTLALPPGSRLGVRVDPRRWCLGHPDADGVRHPCPDDAEIRHGRACTRCQELDPYRWMHIAHRSQWPPDQALREHLMRPHWLYVATFPGGQTKVGTAVDERKRARLDEQGALHAHWIALAADGVEVRLWEDRVSQQAGIGQVVRPAAKAAGLTAPIDLAQLAATHQRAVERATEALTGFGEAAPFAEPWPNPRDPAELTTGDIHPYPDPLSEGCHGFSLASWWGPAALVVLDDAPELRWAVDLSALLGHRVEFGDWATASPAVQDALF